MQTRGRAAAGFSDSPGVPGPRMAGVMLYCQCLLFKKGWVSPKYVLHAVKVDLGEGPGLSLVQ